MSNNKKRFETVLDLMRADFASVDRLEEKLCDDSEMMKLLVDEKLYGHMLAKGHFTGLAEAERWKHDLSQKYDEAKQMVKELESWGLKDVFAVIKGCALNCMIYGDKEIRPFGDLDILIDPSEAQHFHEILQEKGFYQMTGPSSVNSSRGSRAFIALHVSGAMKTVVNSFPVKTHQDKVEYKAYHRPGSIRIEVHDGLHYIPRELTAQMLHEKITVNLDGTTVCNTLSPEHTFIFLLANTYENSESFYANTYDFDSNLGDYADIRCFVKRYAEYVDWKYIAALVRSYGLEKMAGTVLANLDQIYGRKISCRYLPDIIQKQSEWGIDILERMMDDRISRNAALKVMRNEWKTVGSNDPYHGGAVVTCETCPDVSYSIRVHEKNLELTWYIPEERYSCKDMYLYQLSIYPLSDDVEYTVYKIDHGFYEADHYSCGHSTMRYTAGAVRKNSKTHFEEAVSKKDDMITVKISVSFEVTGLNSEIGKSGWCFRGEVFFRHYGEYYHSFEKDRGTKGIRMMECGLYE
ncbi:MAG: nucleotidyltransferase family protein [Anaerovoracaceae bacterium]